MSKPKLVRFAPMTIKTELEEGDFASFTWSIRAGYPRITVFTSNKKSQGGFDYNTMITSPFDYISINQFLDKIDQAIANPEKCEYSMGCWNTKYVNNEKTNEVILQSKAMVGRDADGVLFLASIASGKAKIKFKLLPSKWYTDYDATTGDVAADAIAQSNAFAKAYLKRLRSLFDIEAHTDMGKNVNEDTSGSVAKAFVDNDIDDTDTFLA